MNTLVRIFSMMLIGWCAGQVATAAPLKVNVRNSSPTPRRGEVVEIAGKKIDALRGKHLRVTDASGLELPSQYTYDNRLIVFGDFPAQSTTTLSVEEVAEPMAVDTVCVAQFRPDKQDDFAWENDRCGYRLYGPLYRNVMKGKVAGYDIWTKSVPYPTLKQRYDDHEKYGLSYHKDFGSGMDVYTVGRTLGAGMNALMDNDTICYPCCYEKCEFLDNGPIRLTARVTCYPENIGNDKGVVETRIIQLDRGSWLNRTTVSYEGLTSPHPLTTGIVVHKQNRKGVAIDPGKRYLAYVDLTDTPGVGNGAIFIGVMNPQLPDSISYNQLTPEVGDAIGQVQTFSTYRPGDEYTYYWGAGWSKGGVRGMDYWTTQLHDAYTALQSPLEVTVE